MTNEESDIVSFSDSIEVQSEELISLSTRIQRYGILVLFISIVSIIISASSATVGFVSGIFVEGKQVNYVAREIATITAAVAIMFSMMGLYLMVHREALVRRGQVIVDVLIEESERTNARNKRKDTISVKVAIRSFTHLKGLPLLGDNSSGLIYMIWQIAALIIAIIMIISVNFL